MSQNGGRKMSKYKVGDKVVYEVKEIIRDNVYLLSGWKESEPLSTYTEPLEDKIKKLMEENIRLIAENTKLKAKDDVLKTSCDDYEEKVNDMCDTARVEGQDEAWELARKIILPPSKGGISSDDYIAIFGNCISESYVMKNYTYSEAATKVAEWEEGREEIKVGDVLEGIYDNTFKCVVTNSCPDNMAYLVFDDGTAGWHELDNFKKTGRHIDIDSFLKQIGGEE